MYTIYAIFLCSELYLHTLFIISIIQYMYIVLLNCLRVQFIIYEFKDSMI